MKAVCVRFLGEEGGWMEDYKGANLEILCHNAIKSIKSFKSKLLRVFKHLGGIGFLKSNVEW